MRSALVALLAMCVIPLSPADAAPDKPGGGDRLVGERYATRSPVLGMNGIAATSHPLASEIAIDILKQGGSAADAAIAANAALGLMEPTGNGMGGDLFAIVWDPETERLHGLNASGRAPLGQTLEELKARLEGDDIPDWGSLSVSVPGAVDGWFELHERFGKLEMADTLAPAIRYAEEGFPVTQVIGYYLTGHGESFRRLHEAGVIEEIENYKATYEPEGRPLRHGDVFRNPDLANTLRMIAEGGRDAYYEGPIAETIDAYMRRIGGPLRKRDFAEHESEWTDPVSVDYRGFEVWELPPNGQGIAALQMLNILEGYDIASMGFGSADYLHVSAEAKKLAFADRARFYADPDFYRVPISTLLSKDYAAQRRALIDMERAMPAAEPGSAALQEGDTIYLTVADKDGMMVSLIQSNYRGMGSGLVPDGLGFMLQDRGALFSLDPGHPNVYAPGKRPFHTIIPAFVTKDGKPWMSFGLMGGAMQPQGHAQMVVNMIDFGMGVQEAGDAARYNHAGSTQPYAGEPEMTDGGVLQIESGIPQGVREALEARGHDVTYAKGPFGGYQAIWKDPETGVYWGATEMRKDGIVVAY